jgi:NAD(P)-dependent dehydrogenase (short-subunit alcohol dehydrogenase family)
MNVLIMGATRGIGLQLLKQALEHGHTVTALVRDLQRFSIQHDRLKVIKGRHP